MIIIPATKQYLLELTEPLSPLFPYIKRGTFKRDMNDEIYAGRVAYTHALRKIVYNPALFNEILLDPTLKELFFRGFGYQGNLDFTIYPNAWLRDLALSGYDIGKKVYLADGIVLGTNQVSLCQTKITVAPITIGDHTIFDQYGKIGLATKIGQNCVIGISCHVGLHCKIGNNVKISPLSSIGHFCKIGDNVKIGAQCLIGEKSILEEGSVLKDYTQLPPRSYVTRSGVVPHEFSD